ncbi:hypothetical protein KKC97_06340 [bacterium]|nr:hypothetical protein [bacterium]
MKRRLSICTLAILCIAVALLQSGCTVSGALIGNHLDRMNAKHQKRTAQEAWDIPVGCQIMVASIEGDTLYGINGGLVAQPDSTVGQADTDSSCSLSSNFPSQNDTIIIHTVNGDSSKCIFAGFDKQKSAIRYAGNGKMSFMPVASVKHISDTRGDQYDIDHWNPFKSLSKQREFEYLLLETENNGKSDSRIPYEDINFICCIKNSRETNYQAYGILLGLSIDAAIIYTAIHMASQNYGINMTFDE